ncbi:hypothetical protein Q3G72_006548 [Acer saccharum]|nr:hypothetical protein Q3G72_006548 [Acer saccharum]
MAEIKAETSHHHYPLIVSDSINISDQEKKHQRPKRVASLDISRGLTVADSRSEQQVKIMEVLGEGGGRNTEIALHQELATIEGGGIALVGERFHVSESGEEEESVYELAQSTSTTNLEKEGDGFERGTIDGFETLLGFLRDLRFEGFGEKIVGRKY